MGWEANSPEADTLGDNSNTALHGFSGTGCSIDTTIFRSGTRSLKVAATSGVAAYHNPSGRLGGYQAMRCYIQVASRPATTARSILGSTVTASCINIRLNPSGTLAVFVGSTLQGTSTTALTDTTRWYRIEWWNLAGTAVPILRIDGVNEVTGNPTNASGAEICGCDDTVADAFTVYYDDYAIDNTTWPGAGSVVLSVPISDNARGGWTAGAGGTTNLWDAVNNTPPIGVAAASATNTSQIKNAVSSTTDNCDFNMQSYTTAGVPAGSTINHVQAFCVHGEQVGTATKAGALLIVSNPVQSAEDVFTAYGGDLGAEGTYPTNWSLMSGGNQAAPSVTLGTSPVVRVGKRTATTRVTDICFVGLYIDYTPPAAASAPIPGILSVRQSVNRGASF